MQALKLQLRYCCLGYVQGMSDLLAPLFAVMNDEVTAFWAFVGFMDRMVCSPQFINAGFLATFV